MTDPDVVGTVEIHATIPIRIGGFLDADPNLTADDTLDIALDCGLEELLAEALHDGTTTLTVQYRGGEASERTPR